MTPGEIQQLRAEFVAVTDAMDALRDRMTRDIQLLGLGALLVRGLLEHCEPSNTDEFPEQAAAWRAAQRWLEGVERHLSSERAPEAKP